MTDQPPPSWQPPPPPPPSNRGVVRTARRTPLDQVPSPYGLVVAFASVLIFMAPNLLTVVFNGLEVAGGQGTLPEGPELIFGLLLTVALQVIVYVLSVLPLLAAGRPYRRLFGPTRNTALMWAIGLGVGVVTLIVAYSANAFFILTFGGGEAIEQQTLDIVLQGGAATTIAIFLAVVLAPLGEEVVFRGVLFRALSDRVGMWAGAVLSAAVFALIHIEVVVSQPFGLVGLFAVGLLMAIAYHRTGALIVPIIGHAVFNGMSIAFAILADRLELVASVLLPAV